jgi:hypothetical protein
LVGVVFSLLQRLFFPLWANALAVQKERTRLRLRHYSPTNLFGMQTQQRSRLMRLSWEIQKLKNRNRSKALLAAWAIFLNEDITVFHLTRKHSHERYANRTQPEHLTLF